MSNKCEDIENVALVNQYSLNWRFINHPQEERNMEIRGVFHFHISTGWANRDRLMMTFSNPIKPGPLTVMDFSFCIPFPSAPHL